MFEYPRKEYAMIENLPGTCAERLAEMRYRKKLNQKQLSKELEDNGFGYFNESTISRAEGGKTTRINTELIEALSRYYGVTADYLLGLTNVPDKKNYELSELGLSYEAALNLIRRDIDPDGLNLLMRCEGFQALCAMAAAYFSEERKEGYEEMCTMFPDLTSLYENPDETMDTKLSASDKRRLEADLAVLREPEKMQKDVMIDQFRIVTEELADNMRVRPDPERISEENNQFTLRLRQEVMKRQRKLGKQKLSEADMAKIMARIIAVRMGLHDEEKDMFEQLYLTMMRNRAKKKTEPGVNSIGQKRRTG